MNDNNLVLFYQKMVELTKGNEIVWSVEKIMQTPGLGADEDLRGNTYVASYDDKRLCIYQYEGKHYFDYDEYRTSDEWRLVIIDKESKFLYGFPDSSACSTLYNAVSYQVSGAGDLMKKILGEQ